MAIARTFLVHLAISEWHCSNGTECSAYASAANGVVQGISHALAFRRFHHGRFCWMQRSPVSSFSVGTVTTPLGSRPARNSCSIRWSLMPAGTSCLSHGPSGSQTEVSRQESLVIRAKPIGLYLLVVNLVRGTTAIHEGASKLISAGTRISMIFSFFESL